MSVQKKSLISNLAAAKKAVVASRTIAPPAAGNQVTSANFARVQTAKMTDTKLAKVTAPKLAKAHTTKLV